MGRFAKAFKSSQSLLIAEIMLTIKDNVSLILLSNSKRRKVVLKNKNSQLLCRAVLQYVRYKVCFMKEQSNKAYNAKRSKRRYMEKIEQSNVAQCGAKGITCLK